MRHKAVFARSPPPASAVSRAHDRGGAASSSSGALKSAGKSITVPSEQSRRQVAPSPVMPLFRSVIVGHQQSLLSYSTWSGLIPAAACPRSSRPARVRSACSGLVSKPGESSRQSALISSTRSGTWKRLRTTRSVKRTTAQKPITASTRASMVSATHERPEHASDNARRRSDRA